MKEDIYYTIQKPSEGMHKVKGSKFISFAYPIKTEEAVKDILGELRKKYQDARHQCYAYQLGIENQIQKSSDAGEPSNTAGKPILNQIQVKNLTNILVVVVRYFGGTLLGVSGLINAYKNATAAAIDNAEIVMKTINDHYQIEFDYADTAPVMKLLNDDQVEIISQHFQEKCRIQVNIRQKTAPGILKKFDQINSLKFNKIS
ncbi:MAG: YigZ family protein [bacterium]